MRLACTLALAPLIAASPACAAEPISLDLLNQANALFSHQCGSVEGMNKAPAQQIEDCQAALANVQEARKSGSPQIMGYLTAKFSLGLAIAYRKSTGGVSQEECTATERAYASILKIDPAAFDESGKRKISAYYDVIVQSTTGCRGYFAAPTGASSLPK